MALTKQEAEALGWTFKELSENWAVADRYFNETVVSKSHPDLERLLEDIERWENHRVREGAAANG